MLNHETQTFISDYLPQAEGWLFDDGAIITACILQIMAGFGVTGPSFEIGVFKGKYLSLLHHTAHVTRRSNRTFGLDTFAYSQQAETTDLFKRFFGSDAGLDLIQADSVGAQPDELLRITQEKPAIISIDGDHTNRVVLSDHVLCAEMLTDGGIIASDDVCNASMLGVMDGLARFLLNENKHDLVPVAYAANKLFLCHRHWHQRYSDAIAAAVLADTDYAVCERFRAQHARGPGWYKNEFFTADCLLIC